MSDWKQFNNRPNLSHISDARKRTMFMEEEEIRLMLEGNENRARAAGVAANSIGGGAKLASSATFTSNFYTNPDQWVWAYVYTTTGYVKIVWWDQTSSVVSSGSSASKQNDGSLEDRVWTIFPCLADGTVSGNLTSIEASSCHLVSVNINDTMIEGLYLPYNHLGPNLDLSGLRNIQWFNVNYNNIDQITLPDCAIAPISYIEVSNNNLTKLDARGFSGLLGKSAIYLSNNLLDVQALNAFYHSLGIATGEKNFLNVSNNPGVYGDDKSIATDKGWFVGGSETDEVEFKTNKTTGTISGFARSTTGIIKISWSDGTSEILGVGIPSFDIEISKDATTLDPSLLNLIVSWDEGDFRNGNMTSIELQSMMLTNIALEGCQHLESVIVRDNPDLIAVNIPYAPNLALLLVTGCSGMTRLEVSSTAITSLDLNTCTSLEALYAQWNPQLTTVANLYSCPNLISAYIQANFSLVDDVDFTGCPNIESVGVNNCNITSLNVTGCSYLTNINCEYNPLMTSLGLSGCVRLSHIWSQNNTGLTSIDFSGLSALNSAYFPNCSLETVTFLGNTDLSEITLSSNALTSIDFTETPNILNIYVNANNLDSNGLNTIFTAIPDRSAEQYPGFVWCATNPGSAGCDPEIGRSKHWTINN